jgi:DNA helicase-2/ATP-dependent DNA helicase PcrA
MFPGWRSLDTPDGIEEERRLCYVGITRAKERLWLTSAERRTLYGKTDYTRESQFLRELDKRLIEGDGIYEKKSRAESQEIFTDGVSSDTPFKPFDQLKYAKQQTKKNVQAASESFATGDRVKHSKFGEGVVLATNGKVIEIEFADGRKKLAIGFAPITKL